MSRDLGSHVPQMWGSSGSSPLAYVSGPGLCGGGGGVVGGEEGVGAVYHPVVCGCVVVGGGEGVVQIVHEGHVRGGGWLLLVGGGDVPRDVVPLDNEMFARPGITPDEEVHMSAMAVIFTRPVLARHFLGVLVWMSTIFFPVPAIPRRTSRSSPLLSFAHHGVARCITVHPSCLCSNHTELGMPWDSCCCRPLRQCFPFCIMIKVRISGGV